MFFFVCLFDWGWFCLFVSLFVLRVSYSYSSLAQYSCVRYENDKARFGSCCPPWLFFSVCFVCLLLFCFVLGLFGGWFFVVVVLFVFVLFLFVCLVFFFLGGGGGGSLFDLFKGLLLLFLSGPVHVRPLRKWQS